MVAQPIPVAFTTATKPFPSFAEPAPVNSAVTSVPLTTMDLQPVKSRVVVSQAPAVQQARMSAGTTATMKVRCAPPLTCVTPHSQTTGTTTSPIRTTAMTLGAARSRSPPSQVRRAVPHMRPMHAAAPVSKPAFAATGKSDKDDLDFDGAAMRACIRCSVGAAVSVSSEELTEPRGTSAPAVAKAAPAFAAKPKEKK